MAGRIAIVAAALLLVSQLCAPASAARHISGSERQLLQFVPQCSSLCTVAGTAKQYCCTLGLNCFAVDGIPTEACYNPNSPTLQPGQEPTTLAGALATLTSQDLANGGAIDPYTGQKVGISATAPTSAPTSTTSAPTSTTSAPTSTTSAPTLKPTSSPTSTPTPTPTSTKAAAAKEIRFVAYNDQHGRIEPSDQYFSLCNTTQNAAGDCSGGFARMSYYVKQYKAKYPNTVFLHAGDEYTGTIWSFYYNGTEASTFDNLIGVEIGTLGNHEFDKGPQVLADNYLSKINFPIVSCNVHADPNSPIFGLFSNDAVVKTVAAADGTPTKIGFVGWTTTETTTDSSPGPTVHINDYAPDVQRCINQLTSQGINIIIGIGHAGVDVDESVAKSVSGLSLVIGGHSHTFMWPPTYSAKANSPPPNVTKKGYRDPIMATPYPQVVSDKGGRSVPYFQALWGTRYMDTIKAVFKPDGSVDLSQLEAEPVLMGGANSQNPVPQDQVVLDKIAQFLPALDAFRGKVVGHTNVDLIRPDSLTGGAESNLADLVVDAMVYAWQHKADYADFVAQHGPINIALSNPGGYRVNLPAGDITYEQVVEVLPFGDYDVIVQISGATLIEVAKVGIDDAGSEGIGPGTFSGLKLEIDVSNAAAPKLTRATVKDPATGNYVPIDPAANYNVIVTNYIQEGGSGYALLQNVTVLVAFAEIQPDDVVEYLAAVSPYPGKTDGRVVITPPPA